MKKILILIYLISSFFGFSQIKGEQNFNNGITFYNEGRYLEAIDEFKLIIENGEHSAALYFNLGKNT